MAERVWQTIIRPAISDNGELWFPDRLTREYLDQQKHTLGPYLFSAQYLLQYIAPEDRRFEPAWIQYFNGQLLAAEGYHTLLLDFNGRSRSAPVAVYTTVDPAISETKGDYTAIITLASDVVGNWYILAARRFRGGANRIIDEIVDEIRKYSPAIVGIETVAFQKAIKEFLMDRLREENLVVSVQELTSTVGRGKRARIEGLVPKFSTLKVFLARDLSPELEREILSWSPTTELPHDDMIDALSFQLEVSQPASMQGQKIYAGDWHDLSPEDREKIRKQKAALDRAVSGGLRTGYE